MKIIIPVACVLTLAGASSALAQPNSETKTNQLPPGHPDVAVVAVTEPDRGGAAADGDLWRQSTTVAVEGQPGVLVTRYRIANTPIPDSVENRRRFGGPMSEGGRRTQPRPGPVG